MTFRDLPVGDLFRFPHYDDPLTGTVNEGALLRKINHGSYVSVKDIRHRLGIDDPTRHVYREQTVAAH
jgi:hypothetical protein